MFNFTMAIAQTKTITDTFTDGSGASLLGITIAIKGTV